MGANLWAHHVLADDIPQDDPDWSPTNVYRNYWGFEIDMLETIAEELNFTYTIENPPDLLWGHITGDGTWDGLVNLTAKNQVDLIMSDILIVYSRMQVLDGMIPFDSDYLVPCVPLPKLLPKILALVYPYDWSVWIIIFLSMFVVTAATYLITTIERDIVGQPLSAWSSYGSALWYSYGTLMGEAITRDTKSDKANSIRYNVSLLD